MPIFIVGNALGNAFGNAFRSKQKRNVLIGSALGSAKQSNKIRIEIPMMVFYTAFSCILCTFMGIK